jgi:hypothetical protein
MLEVAVQLEFATIPPYLCALWSIADDLHPMARSLREVVQEEMLHLALTCNMLVAVGGKPTLYEWAPVYPTHLPGKVHPDLKVHLRGLDDEALRTFVRIESPERLPDNVEQDESDPKWVGGETIGELYETILAAFRFLKPSFRVDSQVTGHLAWRVIASLADVESAIRLIQRQGEGAVLGPLDSSRSDLAHYYRFLEMLKGKRLVYDETRHLFVWHKGYNRPTEVRPMGEEPINYNASADPRALELLRRFDRTYRAMLRSLDDTWQPGGQGAFIKAIELMFELEKSARPLMEIRLPHDPSKTYGPQFRTE